VENKYFRAVIDFGTGRGYPFARFWLALSDNVKGQSGKECYQGQYQRDAYPGEPVGMFRRSEGEEDKDEIFQLYYSKAKTSINRISSIMAQSAVDTHLR
jgi:hypothetical protein